ncbi:MAG: hypothetical protein ACREJ2_08540, partial [Planctomycetota bacterium]
PDPSAPASAPPPVAASATVGPATAAAAAAAPGASAAVPGPENDRAHLKVAKPTAGDTIPTLIVFLFLGMLFAFLIYFAYKNLTKPPEVVHVYPVDEQEKRDLRTIPLRLVLHAEKIAPLPASEDSRWLEENWIDNPPGLPEDAIYGPEGRRRYAITYTWKTEKVAAETGTKQTIPSLVADWTFGAIFEDQNGRSWPGFPLISKYAFENDLEVDATVNLPGRAKLLELYTDYIYEGESTGLKVLFFVPETSEYDLAHGKKLETRIFAQLYLLRFNRYYALTDPAPTTIEPFKDFTLAFRAMDKTISLEVNGAKVLNCPFPTAWPKDDSYIGGVPGTTFADGAKPHHAGYIEFRAPDFGNIKGKGFVKEITIKGTPAHQKVNTMRERVWLTDYRPRYIAQQKKTGKAEVTPLPPPPETTPTIPGAQPLPPLPETDQPPAALPAPTPVPTPATVPTPANSPAPAPPATHTAPPAKHSP